MTKQTKTKLPNTGEPNKATVIDFDYTALGILMNSYKANGIHISNEEKYWELYEKELQIAFNSGRASAISELTKS